MFVTFLKKYVHHVKDLTDTFPLFIECLKLKRNCLQILMYVQTAISNEVRTFSKGKISNRNWFAAGNCGQVFLSGSFSVIKFI